MKCLALLALFSGMIFLQSSSHATQPPQGGAAKSKRQPEPAAKAQRTQYAVKHIDASALASVLNKHFRGEAEIVGTGNTLLISGSSESIGEVIKLLEQLDQKPKTIEVELVIAEIVSKKGADAKDVDVSGLEPMAKLEALTKGGQIGTIQRIKLTAVEGQPITSTNAANKPYVGASTIVGGGPGGDNPGPGFKGAGPGGGAMMRRSISYHEAGTTVKLTAKIGSDDTVALDLNVQDSKVRSAEAGDEVGAATFDNNTLNTKLNVPSGKAVAVQTVRTEGKAGGTLSLVIVTARVVEQGQSKNK
jgi:hypothetical protein